MQLFIGTDADWIFFDLFVLMGTTLGIAHPASGGSNIAFLRLLLMLKNLIRTSRLVKLVRTFREVRVIILSAARSYVSFLTSMLTLFLFIYMFAILLTQGVASYLQHITC